MGVISREFSADFMKQERLEKARLIKIIDNSNPDDESDTITQAKVDLQVILDKEGERIMYRSGVDRVVKDEKCSSFFFGQIKENHKKAIWMN